MKKIICICLVLIACKNTRRAEIESKVDALVTEAVEAAYFEGQLDAISHDVRIEKVNDSTYRWTKSCWDSGKDPIFQPTPEKLREHNVKLPIDSTFDTTW